MMKIFSNVMKYWMLLVIISTMGCETIIDVDLPTHEPVLVLNSFFGPDTTFTVSLHESKDILDDSYGFNSVPAADLELYIEDRRIGRFRALEGASGYYTLGIYPESGVEYTIVASRDGYKSVEATDMIPNTKTNPAIEEIVTKNDQYGSTTYQMTYSFNDAPGEDFYEVLLFAYIPQYEYYSDEDTTYYILNGYYKEQIQYFEPGAELNEFEDLESPTLFTDILFDGKRHSNTIEMYYYFGGVDIEGGSQDIRFSLEVRHISSAYYRYKLSRQLQQQTEDNPFAEAAPVYNNIDGGFGIFAGYGVEKVEFEYGIE